MKIEPPFVTFPHQDKVHFRSAVEFTAIEEGFRPGLVEKDYFCSLLLRAMMSANSGLAFKGGTCLSKVYSDFYRLSEDLDFSISISPESSRGDRRKKIIPFRETVNRLPGILPGIKVVEPLTGHNKSTQYIALLEYTSLLAEKSEIINIEIGMREVLREPVETRLARTLLRDSFSGKYIIPPFPVKAVALQEALAEKVRAALTRDEPAIRDFFDLDYAVRNLGLDLENKAFLDLVRLKIAVPGSGTIDLSDDVRDLLERQIKAQLMTVLRESDFKLFDLDRIVKALQKVVEAVKPGIGK
ncbi:MAG: nucleotidyl transferase AbiEii/AbiGii toxin family protein [Candidatus Euphemobacter frigidus]|nr:nucleotidyl transferase AbiEii/AbiGii toxin family protein [Candidatus Euphemobacter frigidus]MDP8276532.1 nucleotidyl transferase AbiEii/AbiGii toxin family protein [Candidatus Euphemobacter frigidus]